MTLDLSAQELDFLLKTLDTASVRGIDTQRLTIQLADRFIAALKLASDLTTPPAAERE